jgi:hypothetical protein
VHAVELDGHLCEELTDRFRRNFHWATHGAARGCDKM